MQKHKRMYEAINVGIHIDLPYVLRWPVARVLRPTKTSSSRSLMYIKNKIGPSTDPCGTPLKTGFQFEISPSTTTLSLLSVSHCSIQFSM